jgi:hypothetical protein
VVADSSVSQATAGFSMLAAQPRLRIGTARMCGQMEPRDAGLSLRLPPPGSALLLVSSQFLRSTELKDLSPQPARLCSRSDGATVTEREPLRAPLGGSLAAIVNADFAVAPG